ncbi:MAG: hypothetical protein NC079_01660 [Clostridium sp.]|nr:hypothetical protein [Acetatifactor muris]MCM1526579.1 hypothetical protein [Bacteroides sp.]MCM1562295.1 hypothetical protein [Clostridium sp.]
MKDREEIINIESSEELKEAKLWLFQECMRLEQSRKELDEMRDKFQKERKCFMEEMGALTRRSALEHKRLKEENLFFDKKMAILQDGFRQLDADRKKLERERISFEKERELMSQNRSMDYYGDGSIVDILFRNATNPLALRKRYKDLVKIFHPDNIAGDEELVQMINREYAKRKREEA